VFRDGDLSLLRERCKHGVSPKVLRS